MIKTSIARKVAMALSGLFLILFLGQHFTINMTSVFSEKTFNFLSHFMGNNPLVQFILQPVLIFGVVFHFILGFVLQIKKFRPWIYLSSYLAHLQTLPKHLKKLDHNIHRQNYKYFSIVDPFAVVRTYVRLCII